MRKREAARPESTLGELFAERQAYLRNGTSSRYVVLSRSLQIGVVVALCLVVGWLGFASYSSVAKHLQTVEQDRELARLEADNESLRAAAETARRDAEQLAQVEQRLPELTVALADAETARERAEQLAAAAAGEAEELRRELALLEDRMEELSADSAAGSAPDSLAGDERAEARDQVAELNQRVADATAEAARLTNELATTRVNAETEIAELSRRLEESGTEIARLNDELTTARERVEASEAALAAARSVDAGETPTLAELKADGAADGAADDDGRRLSEELADAKATIASLNADLAAAKSELEAARAAGTGTGAVEVADAGELERLRQQLARANERVRELEGKMNLTVVNLAPPPSPPAPR